MLMSMMCGALRLGDAGAFGHPARFAAGKLDDVDGDAAAPSLRTLRFALAAGEPGAGGHFGNHQAGAQPLGQAAERRVGDAGHRGQKHAVRHAQRADLQRFRPKTREFRPLFGYCLSFRLHSHDAQSLANLASERKCCTAKNCSC